VRRSTFFFGSKRNNSNKHTFDGTQLDGGTAGAVIFLRVLLPVKCVQFLKERKISKVRTLVQ
jgi:hypothetical protein